MNLLTGKTLKPVALVALFAACAGISSASHAAIVEYVIVGKYIDHVQTSAGDVQVDPASPGPTYGGPYGFAANVMGQDLGSITPPVVSGPMSLDETYFNGGALLYDGGDSVWRLGYPNANDWGSPDLGDLDAHFGSGDYTFDIDGTDVTLNLTGDVYPNTPIVTLSGGFWAGGKYVVNPSQSITITTNAFTDYGSYADGHMGLGIDGIFDIEQFRSAGAVANFLTYTVNPGDLSIGMEYNVWAGFDAVVDRDTTALPGSYNAAYYGAGTMLTISTSPVPVPAAAWLFGSGLLGLIGAARRKK